MYIINISKKNTPYNKVAVCRSFVEATRFINQFYGITPEPHTEIEITIKDAKFLMTTGKALEMERAGSIEDWLKN